MRTDPSLSTGSTPRYLVIAQALLRDIEDGKVAVGDLLPTESELCARFGVSRFTAREAVKRLMAAGMVTRRPGVGTTLRARKAERLFTASVSDLTELLTFSREARLDLRWEGPVVVEGALAEVLPDAAGQTWYGFTGFRKLKDAAEPLVHSNIVVRPGYEAVRDRIREPGVMVFELIEQLYGERIVELRQEISSVRMPARIARSLGVRAGSPALRVLRYYLGAGDLLLSAAINTYPEGRIKLTTRWRLDADAAAPRPVTGATAKR
jgi:DNA-binding GntR family transcriptional regulator